MHLSVALLAHLFSYNITWGATAKEVERSTFFLEVPKIWKRYWQVLVVCFLIIAGMIVMSLPLIPEEWRIPGAYWGVIFPLAIVMASHILFPVCQTFDSSLYHCLRGTSLSDRSESLVNDLLVLILSLRIWTCTPRTRFLLSLAFLLVVYVLIVLKCSFIMPLTF